MPTELSIYDEFPVKRNYAPPPISDKWQKELIRIAGLTPNGLPHLRLVWGSTATWTPYVPHLRYLHHRQDRQTGWNVDIRDKDGLVIRTITLSLTAPIPSAGEPVKIPGYAGAVYGMSYPKMIRNEEVGVPRWYFEQYMPPDLIGEWSDARGRIVTQTGEDMGPMPREGIYSPSLGFHFCCNHVPHICCKRAKEYMEETLIADADGNTKPYLLPKPKKCFGLYRPPSDIDMQYVEMRWHESYNDMHTHDWTEAPDEATILRNVKRMANAHAKNDEEWRTNMKLRIRDTFKTHRGRLFSRKGVDTFIIHRPDADTAPPPPKLNANEQRIVLASR